MNEREIHQWEYPFALLDEIVEIRLNPDISPQAANLAGAAFSDLKGRFASECDKIWIQLKRQIFSLASEENIRVAVDQHLLIIRHLKDQLSANLNGIIKIARYQGNCEIMIGLLDKLELFIRTRYKSYLTDSVRPKINFKIGCALSVDQLGLILRSADDSRLIESKSLNHVFKSIVPYLSTDHKVDISYDSMRASTYHPEASDKEKAVAALEKMINKIREYR